MSDGRKWSIDGLEISLKDITCDTFIVAGETDHITPWQGCYSSRDALGGNSEFVLSQSGHIQSLINPVGNPKARFTLNDGEHDTAEAFLDAATEHQGSWWPHWGAWLGERAGEQVAAVATPGSEAYPAGDAAPGSYVHKAA